MFSGRGIEIARQYREEGDIEAALEYVSEQENPRFRGECFLALARKILSNPSRDEEELTNAKR